MTKKKIWSIILGILGVILIIGNVIFLCQDTVGQYKGQSFSDGLHTREGEHILEFNDNICIIASDDQSSYDFKFYHIIDNQICIHFYSGCSPYFFKRETVFKILSGDNSPFISHKAIFIQILFSVSQLFTLGAYLVLNKNK